VLFIADYQDREIIGLAISGPFDITLRLRTAGEVLLSADDADACFERSRFWKRGKAIYQQVRFTGPQLN
jgi:hypothetical protein